MTLPSALALVALLAGSSASEPSVPRSEPRDAIPSTLSAFPTATEAGAWRLATEQEEEEVLRSPNAMLADEFSGGAGAEKRSWWPVLYSLIIPGTGEISMGYEKRGIALVAAEVIAWTGYIHNHDQGMDVRNQYEAFADMYWTEQKWIDDHPDVYPALSGQTTREQLEQIGQDKSGSGSWPGYIAWTGKEEDKQHYYENIGKYDWFISGWADFDPDTQPHDTSLRTQYREMREKSNDELDTANRFIYLSVAARVFSLVETALLVRSERRAYEAEHARLNNHWRFHATPEGMRGARVSLEYNFK